MATALKEWAAVCDALGRGEQSIVLRKGGIREKRSGFTVEHRDFFLYPTAFHQQPDTLVASAHERLKSLLAPPPGLIRLELHARVVETWRVEVFERLEALRGLHILEDSTLKSRFYYRNPWLEVVLLRVYRLQPPPLTILELPEYAGCHSWVPLSGELPVIDPVPVLSDGQFESLHTRVQQALGPR